MLLHPSNLRVFAQNGNSGIWKGFTITDEFKISNYDAYEYIYAKYCDGDELQTLYQQYPANPSNPNVVYQYLRPIDR